jgi:hypothetical protein
MKKSLIGAFVGGIIIFIWQFLSWTMINLHQPSQKYTPKQEAILSVLNDNLEEGGYYLPGLPENSSMEEYQNMMKESVGKPWATIQYHKAMKNDMVMNMVRGLLVNALTVWLLCWILLQMNGPTFASILTATLFTGFIIFLNVPYTNHIWFESFDLWAHLIDALVSWGLCGLWLAWWLPRNNTRRQQNSVRGVSNVGTLKTY